MGFEFSTINEKALVKHTNGDTNGQTYKNIFFTISPSDEYFNNNPVTAEDLKDIMKDHLRVQRKYIRKIIKKSANYAKQIKEGKYPYIDVSIFIERANRLHCHGVIYNLPESYYPYEKLLTDLSKRSHKVFGKPRVKSDVCAKYVWTDDNWDDSYVQKAALCSAFI